MASRSGIVAASPTLRIDDLPFALPCHYRSLHGETRKTCSLGSGGNAERRSLQLK